MSLECILGNADDPRLQGMMFDSGVDLHVRRKKGGRCKMFSFFGLVFCI